MAAAKKILALLVSLLFLFPQLIFADYLNFNLTPGVTPISRDIYELHMTIFWICVAIGVVVFSVMFYSILKHRKSLGHKAADFHSSLHIEILWAVIPTLILIAMAVPATIVLIRMNDTAKADVNVVVTGYQWKWRYAYLDQGITFFSNLSTPQEQIHGKARKGKWYLLEVDKPLVLPIHKKIRFLVTSNDVIHSWWVPALGIKRDAIPGFIHEAWARIDRPGVYRGQCAELCGLNHAYMPIVVEAVTDEDFQKWVQKQTGQAAAAVPLKPMSKDDLMNEGKKTYDSICASCHQPQGQGMPPTFPALAGNKEVNGPVSQHINIVMNGKPGTAMQAFKTQLSPEQIAAVITYERNSWGNGDQTKYGKDAGGIVQPGDIAGQTAGTPAAAPPAAPATNIQNAPQQKTAVQQNVAPAPAQQNAPQKNQPAPAQAQPPAAPVAPTPTAPATTTAPKGLTKDDLMAKGKTVYEKICSVCHQPQGQGMPPTFPALAGNKIANGPIADHINIVLHGKPGTAMQAFQSQLSDEEIAGVITYERNSWGNGDAKKFGPNAGGIVQPIDITNAKQGK